MYMMDTPLTITHILTRARNFFPNNEIVSRLADGIFRYTYKDMYERTLRLASVMSEFGVSRGDKVATLAWNDHRHLEAYFAMPVMGAIVHTVNMRLSPEHIIYILNHAEDKVLLFESLDHSARRSGTATNQSTNRGSIIFARKLIKYLQHS